MKPRNFALIATSFVIGIIATIVFFGLSPDMRTNVWGRDVVYAPTATPLSGIEYLLNIEADDPQYRAPMPRDTINDSNFYITSYLETIEWIETVYPGFSVDSEIANQFARIDEVVTTDNIEEFYEDPLSPVNYVLGFVYAQLEGSLGNRYKDADAVSACLALRRDLDVGRELYLYLRVPNDLDPQLDLGIPEDWQQLPVPPPEDDTWKSECFDDVHLANLDLDLSSFATGNLPIAQQDPQPTPVPEADIFDLVSDENAPEAVLGTITDDAPFSEYDVGVEQDGSTILVDMRAQDGNLDTLLYLVDEQNNIVAENDDRVRGNTDALLIFPEAPAGVYQVIATRYKVEEGRSTGNYLLNIAVNPPAESIETAYAVDNASLVAAGFPDIDTRAVTDWTVLAYYGGDTNLEPGILNDFNEFELGLQNTESVQVVALVDRHPEFNESNGNWSNTRLYEVIPDQSGDEAVNYPPTIDSEPLAELPDVNTGDGETLAQFLVWAMQKYPANNYVVAFASHGAGWQGLITDDSANYDILSVPELRRAFTTTRDEVGFDKFDLLINDACSMSSAEYYAGVADFFDYSIASPEVVVNPALDMTLLTNQLAANADIQDLSISLVDTYINRDIQQVDSSDVQYLTYAVTNLDGFNAVTEAVNDFAALVNANANVMYPIVGQARVNAYTYTSFLGDDTRIDMGDLMTQVIAATDNVELIAAAQNVIDALEGVRLYGNAGVSANRRSSYYNIYFPADSDDFENRYFDESRLTEWAIMLRGYYNSVTPAIWETADSLAFHSPAAPRITLTGIYPPETGSIVDSFRIGVDVIGRNISHGDLTIDLVREDGTIARYFEGRLLSVEAADDGGVEFTNPWDQGYNGRVLNWDVRLPLILDGESENYELLIVNEGDDVAFLDGRYREPGSEQWNEVTIAFDNVEGANVGTVQRVISRSTGTDALAAVTIAPGSEFQTFLNTVTEDGRVVRQEGNSYVWGEEGLTWDWAPAPTGTYNLGLLMTASGGTTGFASTTVQVDNNLDQMNMLADNSFADLGITLPRYRIWDEWVQRSRNEDFAYSSSVAGATERFGLYFLYQDVPETFEEMVPQLATNYNFTVTSDDLEPATVSGYEGVIFEYEMADEETDDVYNGRAFVTVQPHNGFTYMVSAETVDGDLDALFSDLTETVTLFNPTGIVPSNATATWGYGSYNGFDFSFHPYPITWADGYVSADGWDVYASPSLELENDFFATRVVPVNGRSANEILREVRRDTVMSGNVASDDGTVIVSEGDNLLIESTRTLYSAYHQWDTLVYSIDRDGEDIRGRLYVTIFEEDAYLFWAEAPEEEATEIFTRFVEYVVDGYQIYGSPE
jgi:hypothetical protein